MKKLTPVHDKIKELLGSKFFFSFIIALFVLQAGFIAIRSSYPMAFDETFHVGIIQLYSEQYSPFFSNIPDSTAQYGPLATSPSYLYHYLMSFPYRIIELFTNNTFATILSLRFINIALFAAGIIVFRRVLQYSGAALPMIHLVLLAFVLLPIETFTAAQINYDNLLFLATAATLLFALRFAMKLRHDNHFDVSALGMLAALCLLSSQIKYSFLPIFAGIGLFTAAIIGIWVLKNKKTALGMLADSVRKQGRRSLVATFALLLLSAGLFGWRFGYNFATYGSLMPDCAKVVNVQSCKAWGPWARDYELGLQHTPAPSVAQKIEFTKVWINIMGNQLFAVLDASKGGTAVDPVRALVITTKLAIVAGVFFVLLQLRRLKQQAVPLLLFAAVSITYLGALFMNNYAAYTRFGMPIAIQGRYLLPVLLLMMIVLARSYSLTFESKPQLKAAFLALALIIGLQGAGILTYLMKTDQNWYWTASATTQLEKPVRELSTLSVSE